MFDVLLTLIIKGYADDGTLFIVKDDNNKTPSVFLKPSDDFHQVARSLFLSITNLSPTWAKLKANGWLHCDGTITLQYEAAIALTDKLNGYKWEQYNV